MLKWRLINPKEYPKPLNQLIKIAKRILDNDELSQWMMNHTPSYEDYLDFVDKLSEIVVQPFYEKVGIENENGV